MKSKSHHFKPIVSVKDLEVKTPKCSTHCIHKPIPIKPTPYLDLDEHARKMSFYVDGLAEMFQEASDHIKTLKEPIHSMGSAFHVIHALDDTTNKIKDAVDIINVLDGAVNLVKSTSDEHEKGHMINLIDVMGTLDDMHKLAEDANAAIQGLDINNETKNIINGYKKSVQLNVELLKKRIQCEIESKKSVESLCSLLKKSWKLSD